MSPRDTLLTAFNSPNEVDRASAVCSDLAHFTQEDLVVISRVLVAILHASNFEDLLVNMHRAIDQTCEVSGCAIYRVCDNRAGLQAALGTENYRNFLPDIIPQASELFRAVASRRLFDVNVCHTLQPSLFDEHPASMFAPIVVDDHLFGALAIVHRLPDAPVISAVINEAVIALELLCKADSFSDSLSMRAHFGAEAKIKREPTLSEQDARYSLLTPREKEVLALLSEGLSNKELADRLYISSATCKHHVENILAKLKVPNRAAAVAVGLSNTHKTEHDSRLVQNHK